jgi:mevalonate kinase
MPAFTATAPGKIILFGEHAVVYGEPALAVPVPALQARAIVSPVISGRSGEVQIEAPDISLSSSLTALEGDHPLRAAVNEVLRGEKIDQIPACRIQITSSIPLASGLGSSAAISSALIRALAGFLGKELSDEELSQAVFEVEKIHHGTPSGIDNSVIVFRQPVYYQKGMPPEFLSIQTPFQILIASSGSPGDTRKAVAQVRENWIAAPERYNEYFSEIGTITRRGRELITNGKIQDLGPLMDQNHKLLGEIGVSTPTLDHLAQTARKAGALGAKLSGGGLGGYLIALIADDVDPIREALLDQGAANVFLTTIGRAEPAAQAG